MVSDQPMIGPATIRGSTLNSTWTHTHPVAGRILPFANVSQLPSRACAVHLILRIVLAVRQCLMASLSQGLLLENY